VNSPLISKCTPILQVHKCCQPEEKIALQVLFVKKMKLLSPSS
jgi:hypothetical protein